ncbi:class I adenylate-forming enzyme family protein [Actinomadura physcomitrii]|nr:AMP-binding protein [Actinomadura physcomitrii]
MLDAEQGTPEFWARTSPDAPAVVQGEKTLTYGEWNDRADRVAEGLSRLGLKAGDRLGMRFRLGIEWFVIQRALQKLGVAQVAVNWKLTPDEATYIIEDSEAVGLACNDREPSAWAAHNVGHLITVGQEPGTPGMRYEDLVETPDPTPRFGPLRANLVLYTSGTTGAPRGVPPLEPGSVDADWLDRYQRSVASASPVKEGGAVLLTLPVHHGAGPTVATRACAAGGTVILLDPYDAEEALRLIEKHQVWTWTAVPTMLLRVAALPKQTLDRYDLSSLKVLRTGASAVPYSLKEWVIDLLGPDVLWETYGASEAGMISYTAPEYQLTKPGTSGRPFEGVEIAIVDDEWNRRPAGETGEIAVKTPMVIDHYLGRGPLGEDTLKDGFYRTGDAGHLDEDGFLYITDRVKDMIVAGGVNIYPAEIEKVLVQHPDVIDAAVIGIPEPTFGEQPLAFIVVDPPTTLNDDELLAFLDGKLAPYKRPRKFVYVEELPVNPTGKVLKSELRKPYWSDRERAI